MVCRPCHTCVTPEYIPKTKNCGQSSTSCLQYNQINSAGCSSSYNTWPRTVRVSYVEIDGRVHHHSVRTWRTNLPQLFVMYIIHVSIHVKNLRCLLREVYKIVNRESPKFLWDMFEIKPSSYDLRSGNRLYLPPTRTQTFGLNSLAFRGSLLWNSLPPDLKSVDSFKSFKAKIKNWSGVNCTCKICS